MVIRLDHPEKNSKGQFCNWAVVQHVTKKILGRFTSKEAAQKFLRQMQIFKHIKESLDRCVSIIDEEFSRQRSLIRWNNIQGILWSIVSAQHHWGTNDAEKFYQFSKLFYGWFEKRSKEINYIDQGDDDELAYKIYGMMIYDDEIKKEIDLIK